MNVAHNLWDHGRDMVARLMLLKSFINFLEDNLAYKFSYPKEASPSSLLQKYVYIARFYGLELGYKFTVGIHGPCSIDLAKDCSLLSKVKRLPEAPLPPDFDDKGFLALVRKRQGRWLEIATSILQIIENYPWTPENKLYAILRKLKPWLTKREFEKAYLKLWVALLRYIQLNKPSWTCSCGNRMMEVCEIGDVKIYYCPRCYTIEEKILPRVKNA